MGSVCFFFKKKLNVGRSHFRKAKEEELRLEEEKQRMMETVAKKEKGRHRL